MLRLITWSLVAALGASAAARADGVESMADAMGRMMDAFSNRLMWNAMPGGSTMNPSGWADTWSNPGQSFGWGGGSFPGSPWGDFTSPWSQQGTPWQNWGQWAPGPGYGQGQEAALEGTWVAQTGAVMVIRQGLVRLYLSEDLSQDYELRVSGQQFMLRDVNTGQVGTYTYARLDDHMMLRDGGGNVMLLQRVQETPW